MLRRYRSELEAARFTDFGEGTELVTCDEKSYTLKRENELASAEFTGKGAAEFVRAAHSAGMLALYELPGLPYATSKRHTDARAFAFHKLFDSSCSHVLKTQGHEYSAAGNWPTLTELLAASASDRSSSRSSSSTPHPTSEGDEGDDAQ